MKTKAIALAIICSFAIIAVSLSLLTRQAAKTEKKIVLQPDTIKAKTDSLQIEKSKKVFKKLADTTVFFTFNDLSETYNYKLIDKFYDTKSNNYYDSVYRVIKIFDKKDSLVQRICPEMLQIPWYLDDKNLKTSRSYITKKNLNFPSMDNYCGEIVVADLNFDGLEDFATPVGAGADNGSHYQFYIQNKHHKFVSNSYLTEKVMWFPEQINDSLKTLTSSVPCTVRGLWFRTFRYDTISNRWRRIEDYVIDVTTGKLLKD